MENSNEYDVDIAILTALPIEVLAALKVYSDGKNVDPVFFTSYVEKSAYKEVVHQSLEPTLFHFGYVKSNKTDKEYSVLITKAISKGGTVMSSLITQVYDNWHPRYFFLIGIAMSFNETKAQLGDLVLADRVVCQTFIQQEKGGPQQTDVEISLESDFQFSLFKRAGQNTLEDPETHKMCTRKVITGTFFSSHQKIASTSCRSLIKEKYRNVNLIAGEMEIIGILTGAIHSITGIKDRLFIAKGISDYGMDNKKDTKWRYIAAQHSAKFIKDLIDDGELESTEKKIKVDKTFMKISQTEFRNWKGEMQASQGLFDDAMDNFDQAWEGVIENKNMPWRRELLIRISNNISKIELDRGKISQALNKATISLILSKSINKRLFAYSLYNMGRVLRESEQLRGSDEFFNKAIACYSELHDVTGVSNTNRWIGYTKYKYGDYIGAYDCIHKALTIYLEKVEQKNRERLVLSETYDMLGRCLREIANKYSDDQYNSLKFEQKPLSRTDCVLEVLKLFWLGKNYAGREGNYYRIAESDLSYTILFSYKNLNQVLTPIINDLDKYKVEYKERTIFNWEEMGEDFTTDFLKCLSNDYWQNIAKNFKSGMELTKRWNYHLLECLFLKHRGDGYFNGCNYKEAFKDYKERFNLSWNDVRPQEIYRSFYEINEKFLELENPVRQEIITYLKTKIHCEELFTQDFFNALSR